MNKSTQGLVAISQIVPIIIKWTSFSISLIMCSVVGVGFFVSTQPYVWTGEILVVTYMSYIYLTTLNITNIYLSPHGYVIKHAIHAPLVISFTELKTIRSNLFYFTLEFNTGQTFDFYPPVQEALIRYFKVADSYKSTFLGVVKEYRDAL